MRAQIKILQEKSQLPPGVSEPYPGIKMVAGRGGHAPSYFAKDKKALKQIKQIENNATVEIGQYEVTVVWRNASKSYPIPGLLSYIRKNYKNLDTAFWPEFLDKWIHELKEKK